MITEEVFGPVLHIVRYRRGRRDQLIAEINALGFGLTFGVHSRLDAEIAQLSAAAQVGNVYVNRNIVGAVVGVQPFGGHGLSGTGPKAGGPLYLNRMVRGSGLVPQGTPTAVPKALADWAKRLGRDVAGQVEQMFKLTPLGHYADLAGPVGETNSYAVELRGSVFLVPETEAGFAVQIAAILATGNSGIVDAECGIFACLPGLLSTYVKGAHNAIAAAELAGALIESEAEAPEVLRRLAERDGPIVVAQVGDIRLDLLVRERVISTDTTAAGGNASLMTLSSS